MIARFPLMISADELEAFVFAVECADYRGRPMPNRLQARLVVAVLERAKAVLSFEPVCAVCGCTNAVACDVGCAWVAPNLCSRCFVPKHVAAPKRTTTAKATKGARR
jgi:hypothetical protein